MNASMETVQALLAGSDRINQMKAEIVSVIRIVFGFITEKEIGAIRSDKAIFTFEKHGLIFGVCRQKNDLSAGLFVLPLKGCRTEHFSVGWEDSRIPLIFVETVHSFLPDFLSGMCEHFPGLEDRLAPLFKASGK